MLNKGKGPVLGKLRTIQLIEADLQLVMRIFLGLRNEGIIENNDQFSKFNFGLRVRYSIEEAILEKRLLHNSSIQNKEETMHIITDLSACYNQQLVNITSIVLELIGINRKAIRIFVKILLSFKYFICTSFGISKETYRSESE